MGPGDLFELSLWPPSHGYVVFDAASLVDFEDECGASLAVTGCASDQPEDAREPGRRESPNGDGHTFEDCVISLDGAQFAVRSERLGSCGIRSARTYTVELTATDGCGNATSGSGRIVVEHDRSRRSGVLFGTSLPPNEPPPFAYVHDTAYGRGCERSRSAAGPGRSRR
jgi:hypothetical protein